MTSHLLPRYRLAAAALTHQGGELARLQVPAHVPGSSIINYTGRHHVRVSISASIVDHATECIFLEPAVNKQDDRYLADSTSEQPKLPHAVRAKVHPDPQLYLWQ